MATLFHFRYLLIDEVTREVQGTNDHISEQIVITWGFDYTIVDLASKKYWDSSTNNWTPIEGTTLAELL